MKADGTAVKEIRITDRAICKAIAEEQANGGESTATKTVARVLTEYRTMKRIVRPSRRQRQMA